eukprot:gene7565-7629_t
MATLTTVTQFCQLIDFCRERGLNKEFVSRIPLDKST